MHHKVQNTNFFLTQRLVVTKYLHLLIARWNCCANWLNEPTDKTNISDLTLEISQEEHNIPQTRKLYASNVRLYDQITTVSLA